MKDKADGWVRVVEDAVCHRLRGRLNRPEALDPIAIGFLPGDHAEVGKAQAGPPSSLCTGDEEGPGAERSRQPWQAAAQVAKAHAAVTVGVATHQARAETIAIKPAFRVALRKRRCVIPADGFYEWQSVGWRNQPVYIAFKSREPFGFAGLWERGTSPESEEMNSCTIITTEANELLKPIHDRMPVILTREAEAVWLDPAIQEPAKLLPLLMPYPAEEMEVYPVATRVNNPAHDAPECIQPLR